MITKLADKKKQQEERLSAELKEKNDLMNKEFENHVKRLESDQEQQLTRVNQKKKIEEEKVIRANNMNTELGKKETIKPIFFLFPNYYREENQRS